MCAVYHHMCSVSEGCLLACSSCETAGSSEQGTPTAVSIIQLLSWP
jgi:hypothetical protein